MKPDMFFLLCATALVGFIVHKAAQSSPAVHLTVSPPWPDVFPGEAITLTCRVIKSEGWTLLLVRHEQGSNIQLPASSSNGSVSEFVLSALEERDSGIYQCEAVKGNERAFSNFHTIRVSADRPQAVIVTDPPASVMFTGETVSLDCDIRKGSGWRYSWGRNTQGTLENLYARSTASQQKHILHSVRKSDSGKYLCQGERGQNPVTQSFPGSLVLNVSDEKPKPVITQNPPSAETYTGERVTLSCGFGGGPAGWEYLWYKDTLRHTVPNTDSSRADGSSFTISSAALAHSGEYRCRAARGREPFYSDYSDPVTLNISGTPQTHLTVQSGWTEVFLTETVTLRCVIQGSSTEWMYKWYRDGQELPVDKSDSSSVNGDTHTILSADQSHAGLYTCKGELTRTSSVHSLIGSSAHLSVQALPWAVVTLDEGWMGVFITKGTVAMRCEVKGFTSANWTYTWYRDGTQISLNHTEERHIVGFWDSSSDGEYRCSGNRTDRPYHSLISEGFMPSHIRLFFIVALVGSVIIFITVVVLAVQCSKKCRTSVQIKNQLDGGEFYSRANADYISADHGLPTNAVYEEIDPSTETEGSKVAGQLSFYSAVQLKPLNQGPTA